ncbi:MAG TPA: magnesium-translocating P-type ATPase [Myxococcales bacterium]
MLREALSDVPARQSARLSEPAPGARSIAIERLRRAALASPEEVLRMMDTSLAGLSEEVVEERLREHGENQVAHERPPSWYVQLWHGFANAFSALLAILATVSWLTEDHQSAIIIGVMVLLSGALRFFQERRASLAAQKLQEMVRVTCTVVRQGDKPRDREIPIRELVPGDIVKLSAGDMVPADVRLLSVKDLFVAQSALTGESLPVEKAATTGPSAPHNPLELPDVAFLGTNVTSGTAIAVAVNTGEDTYLGSVAESLIGQRALTSFEKGIRGVSLLLLRFMGVMTVVVFLINGFTKHDWKEAFFFALAIAVGLTPEMLPMIVTGTLALGAVTMSKKKVIVKRLNSIQNFGAMDVLCTDKTGTLTQDRIVLEKHCDVVRQEDEGVLELAYLNSFYQTGLKNLLDKAVLAHKTIPTAKAVKIDEIPFDFSRRIMSVVLDMDGKRRLIAKGAPEGIFKRSSYVEIDGEVQELDPLLLPDLAQELDRLQEQGFRVLAVAYKNVPQERNVFSKDDEQDLVLRGYVAFLDPPKEGTREALAALDKHGVQVKVLTGDNDIVAKKICGDVGLRVSRVLLGNDIEAATDRQLDGMVEDATLFARLSPVHKERVVRALQRRGHVVGFLGDGINDAPALRAADVGISVDNAVDIAKESADLILLEKDLLVLEHGVIEGRRVFGNIVKYIKMGTSSNFGNMFSVLGASAFLPFLPMLPLQLLTQNLLYDFSQLAIPFDRVDDEYLLRPRQWKIDDIRRFMLFFGPVSSVFDYITFTLMFFVLRANSPAHRSLFQSGWFVEGLLSQTLIVHMIRTRKIPFIQSSPSLPLALTTAAVMAAGILLPFMPFASSFGLVPLPPIFFAWLVGILLAYAALAQVVKSWYVRRYGYN